MSCGVATLLLLLSFEASARERAPRQTPSDAPAPHLGVDIDGGIGLGFVADGVAALVELGSWLVVRPWLGAGLRVARAGTATGGGTHGYSTGMWDVQLSARLAEPDGGLYLVVTGGASHVRTSWSSEVTTDTIVTDRWSPSVSLALGFRGRFGRVVMGRLGLHYERVQHARPVGMLLLSIGLTVTAI